MLPGGFADFTLQAALEFNDGQIGREVERVSRKASAIMDKHFALGRYTTDFKQFQQSIDAATSRVTAFGLTAGIYFTIKSAIQGVVKATVEMEKGLTNINVILNLSSRNLKVFSEDLIRVAASTGQTFKTAAQAATEFSRQGLGVEETLKRTRDALILSRMAGIDAMVAVTDLTAAMNSFNNSILDSTQLVSKFVAVDQRFAVSSADLAEAIKRVGSTAQDAGLDIDQLIGLVTALQERTARGGANIGQSFKTILTRVQDPGIIDQLESFGIVARDANRNLLPTIDILKRISHEISNMPQGDAFKIENLIGKLYQINQLKAVMEDLNRKNSTADAAAGTSRGSNNESLLRNEQLNQTLSAQFNRLAQNAKLSASKLGEGSLSPTLKTLFGFGNDFLEFANKTPEVEGIGTKIGQGILKGIGDSLVVGGATLVLILGKLAVTALSKVAQALGSFTFLQAGLHRNLVQLQEQQNSVLQSQAGVVNKITGANAARLGTEREILGVIESQNIAKGGTRGSAIYPISQFQSGSLRTSAALASGRFGPTALEQSFMGASSTGLVNAQRYYSGDIGYNQLLRTGGLSGMQSDALYAFNRQRSVPTAGAEMNYPNMGNVLSSARGGFIFNRQGARDARGMLQGMDPIAAANLNIERTAKIQTGLFGIGMAAPIAFDTLGELAFSGEGRGNRTRRAGLGALGLATSGAAMGGAMGNIPGAVIGGALGGLLGIVNVFKEMNTVLPEVEVKLRGLTDTISRREEMFVDLNKGTEMAEGLTSGRIASTESNLKNFASMRSKLAARMSAAKIPLDRQLEIMGPKGMLSGDQSKLEGFRSDFTPSSLFSAQDLSGFTGLLGTTSPTDKQGMEKLVSGFLSMKTASGKTMLEEISSSEGQKALRSINFSKDPGIGSIDNMMPGVGFADLAGLDTLFGKVANEDPSILNKIKFTARSKLGTSQALVELLGNIGIDASSGITKQGETFFGGLESKIKGPNKDSDLRRAALLSSLSGINERSFNIADSMQNIRAGEFSVFQAGNQASILRAGMTQNPVQIAMLQRDLALRELEKSGEGSLNTLNIKTGKGLAGGAVGLIDLLKTGHDLNAFSPQAVKLQGLAKDVMFGVPGADKAFAGELDSFKNAIKEQKTLTKEASPIIDSLNKELLDYSSSIFNLTNSNIANKKALDITTQAAIDMAQVQSQATMSVNALNQSMIQEVANFKAQRDSGSLGRQAVQSYTLGLEQERVRFGALRSGGFLFSDQVASGQLNQDIGDVSTGKLSGKGVGGAMIGGFSNQLAFGVKDIYRDLIQGANDVGAALKSSFKDAFLTFLDGSKNASDALRSLGLSFANKLLDIAAQGTTNLLFGGLQNLGSAAWAAYKTPSAGATGGYVTGGSGIRDDVPAMLNEGDFVVKQSSVNKYGVGFLNRLAGGGMPLSNFALSDENNPQNRIRMDQEAADLNAVISYQQALDAYNNAKKQRRIGALINLGIAGVGAGIGYAGRTWASSIRANDAISRSSWLPPEHAAGGPISRFAGGGSVDNIPALLTGGEYVVNRNAVSRLGVGFMHRLNRGEVPMYNTGGFVGEAISTNTGGDGESLNDSISRLINSNEKLRTSMEKGGGESKDGGAQNSQPIVGNISINISIDKNGETKADVQTQNSGGTNEDSANQGRRMGELVKAAVLETIIKETRNGGILEQNFQRRR